MIIYLACISVLRRRYKTWIVVCLYVVVAYGLVLGESMHSEYSARLELARYDTNGDGAYSTSEQTIGFDAAMIRVTHDTGKTFAPILGLLVAAFFALILGLLLRRKQSREG